MIDNLSVFEQLKEVKINDRKWSIFIEVDCGYQRSKNFTYITWVGGYSDKNVIILVQYFLALMG